VVLGNGRDRTTKGGIAARIEDTVKVLKSCKGMCEDLGVKVAMENHAGDMHSLELKSLVETAGSDFVGVNLDAGNAVWTLETPLENLENLGKYTLTTSLRDTQVWKSENGVTAQWTAMGEGMVDWKAYFKRFAELCPNSPVQIETISGFNRELAFQKEGFWNLGHWANLRVLLPLKNGLLKGRLGRLISLLRKKMNKNIKEGKLNVASLTVNRLGLV
jgi:sugar phosphate isomerase/epimerase